MKTIANIIIINSQNVKSEHLLAVVVTSVFKEESFVSAWISSIEVANTAWTAKTFTGSPEIPQTTSAACNTSYCMKYKCMQFSVAIFDAHACNYYTVTTTKGCSVNPFY